MTTALLPWYLLLSIFQCLASPFGYESLKYIDYPTHILGKSCKLIPVMLMNFVLYGKIYSLKKYLIVLLITVGVSCFTLLQPKKSGKPTNNSLYGLMLLMVNLLIDGATNSTQGL
jgi:UDP-galactose transporter B1